MSAPELMTGGSASTTPEGRQVDASSTLPDHLIRLTNDWALWRCAGVRGCGFPVSQASLIAAPATTAAADVRLARAEDVERRRAEAIRATHVARAQLTGIENRRERRVLHSLHNLDPLEPSPTIVDRFPDLTALCARLRVAHDDYEATFTREMEGIADELCTLAQSDRFREALLWQNRAAVHTAVEPMHAHRGAGGRRNAGQRLYEQLLAGYLLRYTTKNDTIAAAGE